MTCADFDRWLDEGMPEPSADSARVHAGSCPRCAAALALAREIDGLLASPSAVAPAGLTDRVMARIEASSEARAKTGIVTLGALALELPWWVRAAAEPASALALAFAALLAWRAGRVPADAAALLGVAVDAAGRADALARQARLLDPMVAAVLGRPEVQLGLMLGLASVLAAFALPIFQWMERTSVARARRR